LNKLTFNTQVKISTFTSLVHTFVYISKTDKTYFLSADYMLLAKRKTVFFFSPVLLFMIG
jgi:hypothetical protein